MVMIIWIMTLATHIPKHRMTIQSIRNPRLLRKSLFNQILQELLLMCLHWHQECPHWHKTCHLWHHSTMAKLNAANAPCPPMVNLPQHPQCDCRVPVHPSNMYGEQ